MIQVFIEIMAAIVYIGIFSEFTKYAPIISLNFFRKENVKQRKLKLSINGSPVFRTKNIYNPVKERQKEGNGTPPIIAIIPAWNEEEHIAATIESISSQTVKPDRIIVVVNNTTDNTAYVAESCGAETMILNKNKDKKAGALNYALELLLSENKLEEESFILIADADTKIEESFIEKSSRVMSRHRSVGGVGSIFLARPSHSFWGAMQQIEFFQYQHAILKRPEAFVLSGTASLFRWTALQEVRENRKSGVLPVGESFYDTRSLTEDNEITLGLLTLGYTCPVVEINSFTDVMENYSDLKKQRKRWYLGALQNIKNYGLRMPNWMKVIYWRQQFGLVISVLLTPLTFLGMTLWLYSGLSFRLITSITEWGVIFFTLGLVLLRVFVRRKQGRRVIILTLLYVPEVIYSLSLIYFFILATLEFVLKKSGEWHST